MARNRNPCLAVAAAVTAVAAGASAACSSSTSAAASTTAATPAVAATSSSTASATGWPGTPPGAQARWLLGAVAHLPITGVQMTAHFDQAFRAQVTPSRLNAVLEQAKSLRLDAVTRPAPTALILRVTVNGHTQFDVDLAVDTHGLISGLVLKPSTASAAAAPPVPPAPTTWAGVDRQVRSVAPGVRLLVASVSGTNCRPINALDATTTAPLGSAFKLWVLDALARAVAAGRVSWNQPLTITSQHKSLPSGELQNQPDGTKLTVRQAAADMISVSDNTAADLLITLLGRTAVETAARDSGMADPSRDVPFLTTRELFVLKLHDWPTLAQRYLALNAAGRQALLTGTVDQVPLSAIGSVAWTTPRDIDSLEWFASPTDICHVFASLAALARQPKLAPLATILSINNGSMSLAASQWRSVWFKGGSEPGVLTLNYLATTRGGKSYLVSVLTQNPTAALSETKAELTLISAVTGAFQLAAR